MARANWLRAVQGSEARGDPLPEFKERDSELVAMGDLLEVLGRIDASRRAEVLGYVINRAGLTVAVANLLVPRLGEGDA